MNNFINLDLLSNPLNYLTVVIMLLFFTFAIAIIFPQTEMEPT